MASRWTRGSREAIPKSVILTVVSVAVDDDVRRVEVLVDHVGVVDLAQRAGQGDGQAEERLGGHAARADHRAERHAAEVLEDQPDAVLEPLDPQGADDPVEPQVLDDAVLVGEAGHLLRRRVLALQQLDDDRRRRRPSGRARSEQRRSALAQRLDSLVPLELHPPPLARAGAYAVALLGTDGTGSQFAECSVRRPCDSSTITDESLERRRGSAIPSAERATPRPEWASPVGSQLQVPMSRTGTVTSPFGAIELVTAGYGR